MSKKPSYEELENRVHKLVKIDSERKQYLEDMKVEKTFLSAVLDNAKEAIIICDNKGNIVRFNEVARQLHGIPEKAILPDQWADQYSLYHIDGQTPLSTNEIPLYRALMGEEVVDTEIVVSPKNAVSHIMVCNGQSLHDSNGEKIGAVVAMHDITEQKTAEERNVQLLARIRTTLEATADGLLVVDRNGKQLFFNKRFAKMWGIPDGILKTKDDDQVLSFVLDQLKDPDGFLAKVNHLYTNPEAKSFDTIEFKDDRIFERYSRPHKLNDKFIGRVWSFRDVTDHKLTLAKLKRSENKYKELVENLNDVIFLVDKNGIINFVSKSIERVLGYKPIELIGNKFNELVHPDDSEFITQRFVDVLQGELHPSEYRFLSKKDEYRWVRTSSRPHFKEGQLIGVQGVLTDITDRKMTEGRLKEQTKALEDILEKAADGICVCHNIPEKPYVKFTHWNPRMTEITGYTIEEINREGWYQCMYPDPEIQEKAIERMASMRQGNDIQSEEWIITTKDNIQKALSISTSVLKEENGTIHVIALMQDIDERRHFQDQLITSRKEWENIFQAIGQPTMILNPKHEIIKANKATLKLTGLTENQLKGIKCFNFFHNSVEPPKMCPMEALLSKGLIDTIEIEMEAFDGTFLVSCTPINGPNGHIEKIIHIATDITKTKKMEKALREAHKMEAVGTLAGGIAHEFNNMLGIIIGNTELALDDIHETNPAADCIQEIRTASLRAKDVVRKLLSVARKTPESRKQLQIRTIVDESLGLLRKTIPTSIEIRSNLTCTTEMIMADPTEISQVLINLCINSSHAMVDGKGVLEVILETKKLDSRSSDLYQDIGPGDYVTLIVSDDGIGIAPDLLDRIFEPYFTTKDVDEGLGMGLAVVHGIVKKNEGAIKVESEVGKGTAVEVLFPRIDELQLPGGEEIETLSTGTERILFVDDEVSLLKMVTRMLTLSGYDVIGKTSSAEALNVFKENPDYFDLVITDMTMPEMTGDEIARQIIQIRPDIPIILCTGHSDLMNENKAKQLGIKAFGLKPFGKKELTEMVRKVLDEAKG